MTLPRPVYPGSALMITRRTTQRQFLLKPSRESKNVFLYCLGIAAHRHQIEVIDFIQMSNHLHDVIYDRYGNAPAFYECFHKLLAKCINAMYGRWENVFSSEQPSVVRLETEDAVVEKLIYTATNPVKDNLVETVDEWPGASGYRALLEGRTLRATRPEVFFSDSGDMPEEITLELKIPPELGDRERILARVRVGVEAFEQQAAKRRAETGRRVLGRNAVLAQPWPASPTSCEPRRNPNPTFATRDPAAILAALERRRAFLAAYRAARKRLIAGDPIPFPHGTYWLRRFVGVAVSGSEILN